MNYMLWFAAAYLAVLNLSGIAVMGIDKSRARKRQWRIPEKNLFLVSILGGSLGTWAGMYLFRHKTKHWYFVVGMPLILLIQLAAGVVLWRQAGGWQGLASLI